MTSSTHRDDGAPGGCACCCYLPPYIIKGLHKSDDPALRDLAFQTVQADATARTRRESMPDFIFGRLGRPESGKRRVVYDMAHATKPLPGTIKRVERQAATDDEEVDRAWAHAGDTYDFYKKVLGRHSLDNGGCLLMASVRFGEEVANAYWYDSQMVYGSGDGRHFLSFTSSLAIAAHEMSHGVLNFSSSNLAYQGQTGALNESFCDAMGASVEQWVAKQDFASASWVMGKEILGPELAGIAGVRSFTAEPAFRNHPLLGTDPQPKHWDQFKENESVHYNSGIPNHAFYLAAQALGGNVWDHVTKIWYEAFTEDLNQRATFVQAATATQVAARRLFGDREAQAVADAWSAVGINSEV